MATPLPLFSSLGGADYKIRTAARNPTDSKLILIVDRLTSTHPSPTSPLPIDPLARGTNRETIWKLQPEKSVNFG